MFRRHRLPVLVSALLFLGATAALPQSGGLETGALSLLALLAFFCRLPYDADAGFLFLLAAAPHLTASTLFLVAGSAMFLRELVDPEGHTARELFFYLSRLAIAVAATLVAFRLGGYWVAPFFCFAVYGLDRRWSLKRWHWHLWLAPAYAIAALSVALTPTKFLPLLGVILCVALRAYLRELDRVERRKTALWEERLTALSRIGPAQWNADRLHVYCEHMAYALDLPADERRHLLEDCEVVSLVGAGTSHGGPDTLRTRIIAVAMAFDREISRQPTLQSAVDAIRQSTDLDPKLVELALQNLVEWERECSPNPKGLAARLSEVLLDCGTDASELEWTLNHFFRDSVDIERVRIVFGEQAYHAPSDFAIPVDRGMQIVFTGRRRRWTDLQKMLILECQDSIRAAARKSLRFHEVHNASLCDPVTELPNLQALRERMTRQSGSYALAILDLDRFKAINDSFGHATGTAVLVAIGRHLSHALRETDYVARIGGDEFAVLLNGFDCLSKVDGKRELLRNAVSDAATEVCGEDMSDLGFGVSIGCAIAPADGTKLEDLLAVADHHMYADKRARYSTAAIAATSGLTSGMNQRASSKPTNLHILSSPLSVSSKSPTSSGDSPLRLSRKAA